MMAALLKLSSTCTKKRPRSLGSRGDTENGHRCGTSAGSALLDKWQPTFFEDSLHVNLIQRGGATVGYPMVRGLYVYAVAAQLCT